MDQLTNREHICWAGKFLAVIFNHYFYLRFILTEFEMQDPTLNRTDNGSLYREPFYFDIFYLMYMLNLRYMLNLISALTLTFVSEKKVLPSSGLLTSVDVANDNEDDNDIADYTF